MAVALTTKTVFCYQAKVGTFEELQLSAAMDSLIRGLSKNVKRRSPDFGNKHPKQCISRFTTRET